MKEPEEQVPEEQEQAQALPGQGAQSRCQSQSTNRKP